LEAIRLTLAEQVQARTAELVLSMEVGRQAAAIRELDQLLPTIIEFIRERLALYYSHVYFVDDSGENLVIRAGTGEVGQQLLARRHTLPVGPGSIVGQVAAIGQAIVVSDTATSDIHKPNPLLPDTRSELAVPLTVEGRVLGVLDMQSNQVNTFTEANLTVFEATATQLAIAIDSARQWARSQEAQQRAEAALKQLTRESWTEGLSRDKTGIGFVYDLSTVTHVSQNELAIGANGFSVPLVVQSQQIGHLAVEAPADQPWTEDDQELLSAVAQQLAQKAENLRLFEQTQDWAAREQLTRQIADKVRASRDIETALKTAAEELSKVLGTSRAVVDLDVGSDNGGNGHV
jgi:GAF domain-containing protein